MISYDHVPDKTISECADNDDIASPSEIKAEMAEIERAKVALDDIVYLGQQLVDEEITMLTYLQRMERLEDEVWVDDMPF